MELDYQLLTKNRVTVKEQEGDRSFAAGMNFYKLFWVFFIGCFLGVVVETLWCLITKHQFESRKGLIYGPFNLVYGFGTFLLTISLSWLMKKGDLWVFLGGMVIGDVFEYFCSFLQEAMFGTVSWQYDHLPLSINGRITLKYSIFWGLLALVWMKFIYPCLSKWVEKIPNKLGKSLTWILVVFMVFNTVISGLAVARMSQRHDGIPAANQVAQFLDKHYPDDLMHLIYPNMMYVEK